MHLAKIWRVFFVECLTVPYLLEQLSRQNDFSFKDLNKYIISAPKSAKETPASKSSIYPRKKIPIS